MKQADKEKFLEQNAELLFDLKESGYFNPEDIEVVFDSKAPYQQKSDAFKRVLGGVNEIFSRKDLPAELKEQGKKWKETYDKEMSFKPSIDDWKKYDPNQMSELAESLGYNWGNTEDRSKMMKGLTDYTIKKDRQESYKPYKDEHPIAAWINENIISPSTSDALRKGEEVETTDVVSDVVNAGTYLIPGFGAGKSALGIGGRMLAGAAIEEGNNILQNYAQDQDLIQAGDILQSVGVGAMGQAGDVLGKAGKMIGNKATPGSVGKGAGDLIEDAVNYMTGPTKREQQKAIDKHIETLKKDTDTFSDLVDEGKWREADDIAKKYGSNAMDWNPGEEILEDIRKKNAMYTSEVLGSSKKVNRDAVEALGEARKTVEGDPYYEWAVKRAQAGKPVTQGIASQLGQLGTRNVVSGGVKTSSREATGRKRNPQPSVRSIQEYLDASNGPITNREYFEAGFKPFEGMSPSEEDKNSLSVKAWEYWKKQNKK